MQLPFLHRRIAGQLIAGVGESRFEIQPERPSTAQLRAVRNQKVTTQIEGLDELTPRDVFSLLCAARGESWEELRPAFEALLAEEVAE